MTRLIRRLDQAASDWAEEVVDSYWKQIKLNYMNLQITSVHFDADVKLTTYIEKKMNKLSQYYDRIVDTSIFLKLENSGQVRDKIVEVRLKVPRETLIAKETNKSFEAATDEVVDNLKRQLVKYKEKMRTHSV